MFKIQESTRLDLTRRTIKIIDIGFVAIIYFFIGFFTSIYVDKKLGPFDPEKEKHKTTGRLIGEALGHMYLIGIFTYVIRNIVPLIPFPLNGIAGFDHLKVKEVTNATVFIFIFLLYQKNLRDRLTYIASRF